MEPVKVFDQNASEDAVVEQLGYEQELKRSFGLLGMIGFSFSIVTSWTALSGVLIIGVESGGPPVMIWGWVGVCVVSLAVAYSMAEMCSAYPIAGGQYSWVAVLAPKKVARGLSYLCGWFMLIGILAMGAVNNEAAANFILGIANLSNPEYQIERWHTVLVSYLIALAAAFSNIFIARFLDRMSQAILIWNIGSFFICFITILACNDHKQSPSFVFSEFQNQTGFNAPFAAVLGIVQSAFGMCCYDAPSHMTEEMKDARKEAPRAIVMAVYIGAITGFVFLIALCFCIGDIETTANSTTGVPIVEIFYNSTGSVGGTCALVSLIAVIAVICANSLMAEGSRAVYAFARDNGLPFSGTLKKVHSKKMIPIYAIVLTAVVQIAFNSIYFGTPTGFNTIITIATEGFYVSYAIPIGVRIYSHIFNHRSHLEGPYSLGRWSLIINIVAFFFLAFSAIVFNLPTEGPVTADTMNYTCAAIGVIMVVAAFTWVTTARKQFTCPDVGALMMDGVPAAPEGVVVDNDGKGKGNEKSG